MSQNRVTGLASSFESPPSSSPPAPSAVSALASRFDSPPPVSLTEPHVSEKVSGIASRFGATVADVAAPQPRKHSSPAKPAAQQPTKPDPVVEERPDFGDIAKRFASGAANQEERDDGEEQPNMFAMAASAWGKREEEARPQVKGKVSAFKREFEGAKKVAASASKNEQPSLVGAGKVVEEKPMGVGNITSIFERAATESEKKDVGEELVSQFESAAKVFAGEAGSVEEKEGDAIKSRIADTAKLFGGGSDK